MNHVVHGHCRADLGGSLGWWSDEAGYALGFVTAHLATHDRAARVENALRGCLGLPPLA